ncbi:hypothetical protein [Paraburkholderia phytofirmans]|jgi:hypothetical protein|uniref:Uncharacterized protein n=1 Tax=Paraburkholderia phytofirmans OLGA172 TaxID=1417228 RepID=A0A160FME4_9BURK|nr:hypothetical protein [Paraburkholderia phytofirmans]ANB73386.1 hypothetical protein AYM40_14205 [Paraburkholderia phytofirmans OLGA172]
MIQDKIKSNAGSASPPTQNLPVGKIYSHSMSFRDASATEKPPVKTLMSKPGVNFVCASLIDKSKEEIARQHGAVYDGDGKKWVPYFESKRDVEPMDTLTKVQNLEAVNGNRFYLIQDDPAQRERYL